MKVALVHELLTMRGGAERVLRIFAEMYPEAPIYTLLYDEKKLGNWFPKNRVITPNYQLPITNSHHLHLNRFPKAVETWDFSKYDLVLSSSSAFAHNIITNSAPLHISYINSPARYLWDRTHDVLEQSSKGILGPLKRKYLEHTFHKLRTWDAECADRADKLIAASKEVQRRIELYWRRESEVIYPPIDSYWLDDEPTSYKLQATSYFLIVSTLVQYKRIELAIEACNKLNAPLKIVGEGPHRKQLEKIAGPSIEFLGYQPHEKVKELYTNAKATLFPGDEDFGLVPLESMACGTPVIAYRSGGALETIIENETGVFFKESLTDVLSTFDPSHFDPQTCRSQAQKFSKERFVKQIEKVVEGVRV